MQSFDLIIVGAGVIGSGAAYQAAKAGLRVLVLEQFEINHQMGSSYGASRIIRYAYDHPTYVELMKSAFPAWREIEAEAGETLMTITGGLDFGPPDDAKLRATVNSLRAGGIHFETLTPDEQRRRFPQFVLPDEMEVIYQPDAGVLRASQCVLAMLRLAEQRGATIIDKSPVTSITVQGDSVEVRTADSAYSGARLMLVPGAWGKSVFGMVGVDLPLTPVHAQEQYFRAEPAAQYETGQFPVFLAHLTGYGKLPYGLPSIDGSGLKVGIHGGPAIPDLDSMNRQPREEAIEKARLFMSRHLPGGNGELIYARTCLYTLTPDEHFIIDTHSEYKHVVLGAICSGHGFKFGPLVGQILVDLALQGNTTHDIRMFAASRFESPVTQ